MSRRPPRTKPADPVRVTATVHLPGNRSVGIPDGTIKIDFGLWQSYAAFFAANDREEHRKGIAEWADKYHEECGPSQVVYGDEPGHDFY